MFFPTFRIAVAAVALSGGAANAATISIQNYSEGAYATALASLGSAISEGFETAPAGEVAPGAALSTAVGSFSTLGGTGTGGAVTGTGTNLAVRSGNVFGRVNLTAGGASFLDSNDTWGISWAVSTGSLFDRLVFVMTDAADNGALLTLAAGGTTASLSGLANGSRRIVSVTFDDLVESATLLFSNRRGGSYVTNDGFGLDQVAVNVVQAPATVPLPAGLALLASGLVALGVVRRRRR